MSGARGDCCLILRCSILPLMWWYKFPRRDCSSSIRRLGPRRLMLLLLLLLMWCRFLLLLFQLLQLLAEQLDPLPPLLHMCMGCGCFMWRRPCGAGRWLHAGSDSLVT